MDTGNFIIEDTKITNNMNFNYFNNKDTLIMFNNFIDGIINNSYFNQNREGNDLLVSIIDGDLSIINANFINNDISDSIINIDGIQSLTFKTIIINNNTATNGIIFIGTNDSDVNIENFTFTNNNIANLIIDENNLIQFDNFINTNISNCDIGMNDGNYLFNVTVTGDIIFNDCNIYNNNIGIEIISINQLNIFSDFIFKNSYITNNRNNINSSITKSIESIIHIDHIRNVLFSSIIINDNYAAKYLNIIGSANGNIIIKNTQMLNNMNNGPLSNDILIKADYLINGIVFNSKFINNNQATNILFINVDGDLIINNTYFRKNNTSQLIIDIDGITSLFLSNITVINNAASNIMLFYGRNTGNVNILNFEFLTNNFNNNLYSKTLLLFDSFIDISIMYCNIIMNNGEYIFKSMISGDIIFKSCLIDIQ